MGLGVYTPKTWPAKRSLSGSMGAFETIRHRMSSLERVGV